jgi:integrase/recombinase XerD
MADVLAEFSAFLDEQEYAPRTIQDYLADLRQFVQWLRDKADSSSEIVLEKEAVQQYFQLLKEKGASPGTYNRFIAALRAYERFQNNGAPSEEGIVDISREDHCPASIPDATRKDLRALIKEFHRQQSACRTERQTWHAVRNWAILQVLRETGLRAGKVCGLRVESDAQTYTVGILREIFPDADLSTTARQALMDWLNIRKSGPGLLFTSFSGKPLQPCDLYRFIKTMSRRANVHVTPEMLR